MLIINNSTLSGNTAGFQGGGIFSAGNNSGSSATLTITNSTLSGNSATDAGAAIFNDGQNSGNAPLTITNSTLSNNSGPSGVIHNFGDSVNHNSATVTLGNTILNGSAGPTNIVNDSGTVTSTGYNLSNDAGVTNQNGGTGALNVTGDQTGTAATPLDPKLGPLQDNGGPLEVDGRPTFTHALLPGSPAIDKGKDLSGTGKDQRGTARFLDDPSTGNASGGDNSDIGAFELVSRVVKNNQNAGIGSLRNALAVSSDGDAIYFDSSLNGQAIVLTAGELLVNNSVGISGPGAANLAVDGNANGRVFHISPGKTVLISGLTLTHGNINGGGVLNDHATVTVSNCTISGNSGAVGGGGIYNLGDQSGGSATLTINSCTISGNTAINDGGGIRNDGQNSGSAVMTISNSTISGNSAGNAGGILNTGHATLTITNSTLSGNSAAQGGGIYNDLAGTATLTIGNTILNAGASGQNIRANSGTVASNGFNLSSDDESAFLNKPTDQNGIDPKLGPLTNNGGPTLTHALLPGSPALDAGDNTLASNAGLTTDQRGTGFSRVVDAASDADTTQTVDIGAFEADPSLEDITNKSTPEDTPLSFTFKVGDSASAFTSITASSSNTTLVPNANVAVGTDTPSTRTLSITPAANKNGTTTITVTVTKTINGTPRSMSDTFLLTVTSVNDPPVADSQSVGTNEDTAKAITLTGSDVEGDTLTFTVVTGPAHGTLTGTAPNLTYNPNANYNGPDSFTFKVNDGQADSNTATVSIAVGMVNDPPTADDQSVTTNHDTAKAITLTGSDVEGSTLTFTVVRGPTHGTLSGTPPDLTYTPDAKYGGADSFTFKTNDGSLDSSLATVSIAVMPPSSQPLNISTRLNVLTGENVLIGGFYITGSAPKKVIVRAIGPSLNVGGKPIDGRLGDTVLELFDQTTHQKVASNDNWKVDDATGQSQEATIVATTVPPSDDLESALVLTLNPGPYSAVVSGKDGLTGIALVEAFDLDAAADSQFANISTRGFVAGGDNVMIGGFILGGSQAGSKVLVRGIGPSLAASGVANALPDPRIEVHTQQGTLVGSNDDWKTDGASGQSQEAAITATTVPPTDNAESALLLTLQPGAYTAVLGGIGAATGVALVEIYNLQ